MRIKSLSQLVGRHYARFEVLEDKWRQHEGDIAAQCLGSIPTAARGLTIAKHAVYLDGRPLSNVKWAALSHGITFGGPEYPGPVGKFTFDDKGTCFTGIVSDESGSSTFTVRGYNTEEHFRTQRRKEGSSDTWEDWKELMLGTIWNEGTLQFVAVLGENDVSSRTTLTDTAGSKTIVEMKAGTGMYPEPDSFKIEKELIDDGSYSVFEGILQDQNETTYEMESWEWKGRSYIPENRVAVRNAHYELLKQASPRMSERRSPKKLSEAYLDNISSLLPVDEEEQQIGQEDAFYDRAQQKTAEYTQDVLNFSLKEGNSGGPYVEQILGERPRLTDGLKKVQQKYKDWFEKEAVPNMGRLLKDSAGGPLYEEVLNTIDGDKIDDNYKLYGESGDFSAASEEIYREAYKREVWEIRDYIEDNSTDWGEKYATWITHPLRLNDWATKVATGTFSNVRTAIYERYVKLTILCPESSERPREVLSTLLAVILNEHINLSYWDDDMVPYLVQGIEDFIDGDPNIEGVREALMEYQQVLADFVVALNSPIRLAEVIGKIIFTAKYTDERFKFWHPKKLDEAADAVEGTLSQAERDAYKKTRQKWGSKVGEAFKAVSFGAMGGMLLAYVIGDGTGSVLGDIALGMVGAAGLLVAFDSPIKYLASSKIGQWMKSKLLPENGKLTDLGENFKKFFDESGPIKSSKVYKALKTQTARFAKVLGPALSVFGIVMCAMALKAAIMAGSVVNVIIESLNMVLEITGLVFMGLELFGFAWAGPCGLALFVLGLGLLVFQWVWNIFHPPVPDPVISFIEGPLTDAGYIPSR